MKALSLTQPYATLIAIVAVADLVWVNSTDVIADYIRGMNGAERALGNIRGVLPAEHELAFGDYTTGRRCFGLANVRRIAEPIPCRGQLGLWELPDDAATLLSIRDPRAQAESQRAYGDALRSEGVI